MKQTITIHELAPGLNEWQRMHHMKRHSEKKKWAWLIRAENPQKHLGRVCITYTRKSTRKMDFDNIGASFKAIGDALESNGIIQDDSPDTIFRFTILWEKAKTLKEQCSIIEIEDVK